VYGIIDDSDDDRSKFLRRRVISLSAAFGDDCSAN